MTDPRPCAVCGELSDDTVSVDPLQADRCPACGLRPTWTDAPMPGACGLCGIRHNPRFISCDRVQARLDGVTLTKPEGGGAWAATSIPRMPVTACDLYDEEWAS